MLKAKVGHIINPDSFAMGLEAAKESTKDFTNVKCNFLFTSEKCDIKKVTKDVESVTISPIIGCTSSGGIIVSEGYITSDYGFTGILSLNDPNMIVGMACHETGRDAWTIGRKVAIAAVENAKTTSAPAYFYMVASPKEEEEYLMGIQDVIGRVPMFGGSAVDDKVEENWNIICQDKIFADGVAVAFFYTDREIVTSFTGAYKEKNIRGLITEVKDNSNLVSIDGVSALKKYAHWINVSPTSLKGKNLLKASITKPLDVKDLLGNLMVIRHPMLGEDMGTKFIAEDIIVLGNKVVEGTAIIQCEASVEDLINSTSETLRDVRKQLYNSPAAYVLFHCGGRKIGIGDLIEEVHKQLVKEARGIPFITAFTFWEYGYDEHSANICGGLMLSFTAFGKN